ncbi:SUMF1/EgtB/PvdO family nonheme iron enzyme [Treponema porcinum]|uniref:Formylglycine-generating enzyme, required for sulfatase activity, contains SUMF1/FGE domain n=1 Tax=Treponema porcinum TaxID=261392 RepID=A0A1T4JQG0_TREPO|nr:SUMF1/EgtB/PvdO family nonheme iron enzyme [Treponema porcinum]SJZ32325.1 Formylglycine-generating enzyme, required for sulfatase activity, contains SUMF1/FGE domain [Treponema porcinum]
MKKNRWIAVILATVMALAAFGCKTDTETEWKDKIYCSAVTFISEATADGVKVTMATTTEGAVIYYTTDGTLPTKKSTKYSEIVEFTKDATVKAIAIKEGIENSPVSVATVSIKEKTIIVDKKVDETAPANVTELTAQAKDRRILLTWKDAADSDVYGYEVSYSGTKPINRVVLPALDTTSMMVPPKSEGTYVNGLTNGTKYTFTVKTVDTSGNKSEGVTVTGTPVATDAGETLKIDLTASVPQENGYTGNKSNTKVTVKANITTASKVKKVVWKKDGSLIAKTLLADETAATATETENNAVWTFDITAQDESANGTYTVAAIDEAGREEAEQITIDNFDFTPPAKVKGINAVYSSELSSIIINWTEPGDADYHHVDITFTTNDGTNNSEPSQAITVNKGTLNKTFSDIESTKAYYIYTFVTYDELGNKGGERIYKVSVNTTVSNCPEGFVEVTGTTITGSESWTPSSRVFVSGRSITISDMYVCDHEVTRGEFKEVMGTDLSTANAYDKDGNKLTGDAVLNNPVNYVNWYAAIAYCNKLSLKENLTPCYSVSGVTDWENLDYSSIPTSSNSTWNALTYDKEADGYRLPTAAEWEWLARGGENYTYAGSNTVDDVAWYTTNTNDTGSREVKTKQANGYGLYDMSGNVYEWCYDWYGTVNSSTADTGASSGSTRVQRGGSWCSYGSGCQVSGGVGIYPYNRNLDYGFRVVRSSSK